MKKKLLILLAACLLCMAGIAAADADQADPGAVSSLLSQRLEHMNLKPQPLEKGENSALKGERYVMAFSGGTLELFAYRDEDGAARDLLTVDESGLLVAQAAVDWGGDPHFFLRDNVIVLYVGENSKVLDMLERLCGPQIRGARTQL